ncbi:MAG: hypothetical protein ABI794_03590 [Betaproteobacteria bacterium]
MNEPNVWRGDDGIVRVDYGGTGVVTLNLVQAELAARRRLGKAPQVTLVKLPGVWRVDVQAAAYISSLDMVSMTMASGMVTDSSLGNLAVRVFDLYHRPPFPWQVFANDEDAAAWLRQYVTQRS